MSDDEPRPSLAELAARALRRGEPLAVPRAVEAGERAAHLALLTKTLRDERTRVWRRRSGVSLALAASLIAAFGLRALLERPPSVATSTAPAPSRYEIRTESSGGHGDAIHAGGHLRAGAPGTTIVIATGTKLSLAADAALDVVEEGPTQIFALEAGAVHADVAKLRAGERFLIRTADVEVEVRGTSFRVERLRLALGCTPEIHTRVVVDEGVVVVRHGEVEARVSAGESWPPPCAMPAIAPAVPAAPAPATRSAPVGPPGAPSSSTLAAANELFERAEAARKGGDPRGAVVLFDRLLVQYPSSPLVEHATVERMRALDATDRSRAVAASREYLARFPRGFARAEAEAILAIGP